jgi:hypothetical protein
MLVSAFLTNVNDALRALDDDTPTFGTDEAEYWLRVANRKKNELYEDVTKSWASTYAVLDLGAIVAAASPSYNISATFLAPANKAYVVDTDDHRHEYTIIKPEAQNSNAQAVFVAGQNPQKLYFTQEIIASSQIVGGTLYLPGYFIPANMTASDGTVPVDDPYWLVMATASEIAFNDLTYEDKAPDLNAKANALYDLMVAKNRRGTYNNPTVSPTNVTRIRDTRR